MNAELLNDQETETMISRKLLGMEAVAKFSQAPKEAYSEDGGEE